MTPSQKQFLQYEFPRVQNKIGAIFTQINKERPAQNIAQEEQEVAEDLAQGNSPSPSPKSNANSPSTVDAGSDAGYSDDDESTAAENGPQKANGDVVHTNVSP